MRITVRECPKCRKQALEVLLDRSGKVLSMDCLLCSYKRGKNNESDMDN